MSLDAVAIAAERSVIDDVRLGHLVALQQVGLGLALDGVEDVDQTFVRLANGFGPLVKGSRLRSQLFRRCHGRVHDVFRTCPQCVCDLAHRVHDRQTRASVVRSDLGPGGRARNTSCSGRRIRVPHGNPTMQAERPVPPTGLLRMETSPKRRYQQFAEECERLAKDAKTEHHRTILREMAEVWRKLAERAKQ